MGNLIFYDIFLGHSCNMGHPRVYSSHTLFKDLGDTFILFLSPVITQYFMFLGLLRDFFSDISVKHYLENETNDQFLDSRKHQFL